MVLRDAIIDMWPNPCGAVAVAAIMGLPVIRTVDEGFLAPRRPVWSTNALDLQIAIRRFGYRMVFAEASATSARHWRTGSNTTASRSSAWYRS
jgi:hypothetical protein